jgi:hypothetical protein
MKIVILAALLTVTATAAFALGRITAANEGASANTETIGKPLTLRMGDSLRVPSVALLCVTYVELDIAKVLCDRTGRNPRYEVVFERNRTVVGRIGDPGDQRVFPERQ